MTKKQVHNLERTRKQKHDTNLKRAKMLEPLFLAFLDPLGGCKEECEMEDLGEKKS